jgi:hypothetical protein
MNMKEIFIKDLFGSFSFIGTKASLLLSVEPATLTLPGLMDFPDLAPRLTSVLSRLLAGALANGRAMG